MKKEIRTAIYDSDLSIEAFRFEGFEKPFPNHFHDYYVVGYMESGKRNLTCQNRKYQVFEGNILLFNPGDSHGCVQTGNEPLDYRGLNISSKVMMDLAEEITGKRILPVFSQSVIQDDEISSVLRQLHHLISEDLDLCEKEQMLLLLFSLLFDRYLADPEERTEEFAREVKSACEFMENHYMEKIGLDEICHHASMSKSALLRAFTLTKKITPYSCLLNIRISRAKELLEQGISPAQAALLTGFFDQSHFSNCFSRFIGLPPGVYQEIFRKDKGTDHEE